MLNAVNLGIGHQRGFVGAGIRQHQFGLAHAAPGISGARRPGQRQAHCERAADRANIATQRQLTRELETVELFRVNLAAGRQNAQRNRQIKAARIFRQISRSQVHGDALVRWKFKPGVLDGGTHPFPGLLDLGFSQPDQCKAGQAVGQMHFHANGPGFKTQKGATVH